MPAPAEGFQIIAEDQGNDEGSLGAVSCTRHNRAPSGPYWLGLLLVLVGTCLCLPFAAKAWEFQQAFQSLEPTGGGSSAPDLLDLIFASPDLALDLAINASATNGRAPNLADPNSAPEQRPEVHVVVRTFPVPRSKDIGIAAIGLVVLLMGVGRIAKSAKHLVAGLGRPALNGGETHPSGAGWATMAIWRLAETLFVGSSVLLLATFGCLILLTLVGGASLSWDLVDRTVDRVVGVALPWVGAGS